MYCYTCAQDLSAAKLSMYGSLSSMDEAEVQAAAQAAANKAEMTYYRR